MMRTVKIFAIPLLLALLAFQLMLLGKQDQPVPLEGPVTGELLGGVRVEVGERAMGGPMEVDLSEVLTRGGSCSLLVMVSTHCGISQRMRWSWPTQFRTWSAAVGAPVQAIWLGVEDWHSLDAFYEGYDFEDVVRARVSSNHQASLRLLGVYGTPTVYLVDKHGRLHFGILGDQLPPVESAQDACR